MIADFVGSAWVDPLARLGLRHDLLAITVSDPREVDIPPIGLVEMVDPATGAAREVRVTASVQRRFAKLASKQADDRRSGLRRAGCELIELSTGGRLARCHRLARPSTASPGRPRGHVAPMTSDFLDPGRLWLLLAIPLLAIAVRRGAALAPRRQVRFTQVDLLDEIAPRRPGWRRHLVAVLQLAGLAIGIVAIARPVDRTTERERSEGRILVLFDVSLSMMATDVEPDRFIAAQQAARDFVDEVDPDVEVGLISFSGVVNVEVSPTLDRAEMERGIDNLELAESTAIGDALAAATRLLERGADDPQDSSDDDSGDEADVRRPA